MAPNIIIIFADNLGYGDFGCYGSARHRTPNVDRMAAEGLRLTHYYSCSGVCTPSRASLLTGCYPRRVGLHVSGEGRAVLMPVDSKGLHPDEVTIATLLRRSGYATACIGKWHLGDQPPFLPTRHGFERYFGVPYSDDMTPRAERPHWPPLPLMRDETVIEAPVDRDYLTQRYTLEAMEFIRDHRHRPFFLFLPHAMPGSTNRPFASPAFQGRSANGPYGDSVEEMDWSTGEILRTLDELGLDERTLVIWTSDHGAVRHEPKQGSNAPLKGWAYDTSEGAMRAPLIARWPGHIPAGRVSDTMVSQLDWLPTLAALAGTAPDPERTIDGHDIGPLLRGEDFRSPYSESGFFYYFREQLQAVRLGPWKLYLPLDKTVTLSGLQGPTPPGLYHLVDDPAEEREASAEHPKLVERMLALAEQARAELGDLDCEGAGQRPAGWVEHPTPQLLS